MELNEIIKYLKEQSKELKISDECIFENAVKIYISYKISEQKSFDKFPKYDSKDKQLDNEKKPEEQATKKQLDTLNKYKIVYDKNITKKKASDLINKSMGKKVTK
jgi:hypothetical protein